MQTSILAVRYIHHLLVLLVLYSKSGCSIHPSSASFVSFIIKKLKWVGVLSFFFIVPWHAHISCTSHDMVFAHAVCRESSRGYCPWSPRKGGRNRREDYSHQKPFSFTQINGCGYIIRPFVIPCSILIGYIPWSIWDLHLLHCAVLRLANIILTAIYYHLKDQCAVNLASN